MIRHASEWGLAAITLAAIPFVGIACSGSTSTEGRLESSPAPRPIDDAGADVGTSPRRGEAPEVSFATVYSTLEPHCVGCHGGSAPVAGLDFSTSTSAYSTLVGVHAGGDGSACAASGLLRVDPGASSRSLLYLKISGTQPCGERMPFHGTPLADDVIAKVADWIDEGASSQ
jgi:hypothetical protein